MYNNDLLIRTLKQEKVERPPIWLLRQAGRHQAEYRALRSLEPDFIKFCQNTELTTKAAMIPINKYNLDAAILFSDILTVPNALGMELHFEKNIGPIFTSPIVSKSDIIKLEYDSAIDNLRYVGTATAALKKELNNKIPLIGFCGSPWTLATYMLEGKSSKTFSKAKIFAMKERKSAHDLLEILTNITISYVDMQIDSGADVIMLFDTWGGILNFTDYCDLSLQYMTRIISSINNKVPTILFTKGGGAWIRKIKDSGCSCISLDYTIPLEYALQQAGNDIVLQGNLDPFLLEAPNEILVNRTHEILANFKHKKNFIFNLGHGIPENAKPNKVKLLADLILNFKY